MRKSRCPFICCSCSSTVSISSIALAPGPTLTSTTYLDDPGGGLPLETLQCPSEGLYFGGMFLAARLHLPLRPLYRMERRLCLGRPLRLNRDRRAGLHFRAAA